MLYWAVVFFILSLIAGVLGFGGVAAGAVAISRVLFLLFIVMFVGILTLKALR